MAKDAKGHGSEKRGGGAPKTPTLHEEANMRARSASGMSPDQIAAHPDFGGRYNVPTVNAVVADKQAADELGQGHPKAGAVPVHSGMTVSQLAVAEGQARMSGDHATADKLQAMRWGHAMGSVVNSASTGYKPRKK